VAAYQYPELHSGKAGNEVTTTISEMELKRRLGVWRGKPQKKRTKSGEGKSTAFQLYDIALLARIYRADLSNFMLGKVKFGEIKQRRLYSALLAIEGGLVTKSQYGVYHFHDAPQRPPVRFMKFDFSTGRVRMANKEKEPGKMPSFDKIFGG
jgi:hypothetical protein